MKLDLKSTLILAALLLVATVGSAYLTSWFFVNRAEAPDRAADARAAAREELPFDPELVWDAGPFTVNLATPPGSPPRFVKTGMSFRVNEPRFVGELARRRVQVRDRVITILRTTTAADLSDAEGILRLKERIMDSINELIIGSGGRVYAVYLTELVVQ